MCLNHLLSVKGKMIQHIYFRTSESALLVYAIADNIVRTDKTSKSVNQKLELCRSNL